MATKEQEELLRKLRGRLAFKKQVEPYVIFNDKGLAEILSVSPKSIEELGALKGFPIDGKRVAGWGQAIIDIFNKPDNIEDFEVDLDAHGELQAKSTLKQMKLF
jgi:ribonuclease D